MKISVAIITKDVADELERCLASVDFADEIVVLDQGSTDHTAEVCSRHGARLRQTEWLGFGPTKQQAVELCRNDWVLSLDSDEEVSPELREAIAALPDEPDEAAFAANRLSRFLGRWIRHCGWHPEYVVRLFDRRRGGFNARPVHESVEVTGSVGRLPGLLLHYTYETMEQYVEKLNRYTTLAAEEMHDQGKRTSLPVAVIRAKLTFLKMWIVKAGFLDGWQGTILCMASAFYVLSKYTKLWRMRRR